MQHISNGVLAGILLLVVVACTATPTATVAPIQNIVTPTLSSSTVVPPTPTVAPEISHWLKKNAIPFATTEPGTDASDLMPLKRIIGDARIVALGEATHGTHEFFQMKHRLVEFLVTEMGFTVFAMEANTPEANLLNDYLQTGRGDPAALLAGLGFWTWDTQEVLDLITWMRAYNAHHADAPPLRFTGIDMQSPASALNIVVAYLNRLDANAGMDANRLFNCIRAYQNNPQGYAYLSQSVQTQCRKNLQSAYELVSQHPADSEFALALHSARLVEQFEEVYASASPNAAARDQYLAENLSWVVDQVGANAKVMVWAHNAHVGVTSMKGDSMGAHLRRQYGNQLVNIGFLFYSGSFNAFAITPSGQLGSLTMHSVEPPPPHSYEYYFHSAGLPRYFFNLRNIQGSAVETDWLTQQEILRTIGAAYDETQPNTYFQAAVLPAMFDVVIYFEETSPSHLLHPPAPRTPTRPTYPIQAENLGFENGTAHWAIYSSRPDEYEIETNASVAHTGTAGGLIRNRVEQPTGYVSLAQMVAPDLYRGQRLRLSAYVKTDRVNGGAGILLRVDGVEKILGISNMQNHPIQGITDWTRYEIVLDVPEKSVGIMVGVWLQGTGQVGFDDFQLEAVGTNVSITP